VKAWDIQARRGEAFVRTVLTLSGGISVGTFSKDFSKLIIGDATGKVHLLGVNDKELEDEKIGLDQAAGHRKDPPRHNCAAILLAQTAKRIPKVIIPHREPAPPVGYKVKTLEQPAQDLARQFLEEGQLKLHANRSIGVVQGPNYAETLLYRCEAHEDDDSTKPLKPDWQAKQQCEIQRQFSELTLLSCLPKITGSNSVKHVKNTSLDFDFARLPLETQQELERDRVDLRFDNEHTFEYEISFRKKIFRRDKEHRRQSKAPVNLESSLDKQFIL
jgi:hypothetical protein